MGTSQRPITRVALARFIEEAVRSDVGRDAWQRMMVNHYHDEEMEIARRECVRRLAVHAESDWRKLKEDDVEHLRSLAAGLRKTGDEHPSPRIDGEMPIIVAADVVFYHQRDEEAFFGWVGTVDAIGEVEGRGRNLIMRLRRQPSDDDLRELLAFAYRYGIDLSQFRQFADPVRRAWFAAPEAYWFQGVFGPVSGNSLA